MKRAAWAVCFLVGCQSNPPFRDVDGADIIRRQNLRIEREEWLGEYGSRQECESHFTLESEGFQSYLKAARHSIDPVDAPRSRLGALSFTWYWQRLSRGCYVHSRIP